MRLPWRRQSLKAGDIPARLPEGLDVSLHRPQGSPIQRGTVELLRAYSQMPWLRAIESRVAHAVSTVPWRLLSGRRSATRSVSRMGNPARRSKAIRAYRKQGDLDEIEEHALLGFLASGNAMLDADACSAMTQTHIDLVGDGFWLLERDGRGLPSEFWPLPPPWVTATPVVGGEPEFRVRPTGSGVERRIPASEIVWFKDPDPLLPYQRGTGIGRALSDELDTDEYAARFLKTFFYNDAIPPLVISGEGITPENAERLEEKWMQKVKGFMAKFRPVFLNTSVNVKELTPHMRNLQMRELREFERDLCITVYGMPPEIMGLRENANRSTIDVADFLFARWVVVPRVELRRAALQRHIVPMFERVTGQSLVLDYDSPVEEDARFQLETAKEFPYAFELDELRGLANMEPRGDGEGELRPVPDGIEFRSELSETPERGGEA